MTILLRNNGCSYDDPVLVAILRYFESLQSRFSPKLALEKDFLLDCQVFRLKIGTFSNVAGRIPALRTAHD